MPMSVQNEKLSSCASQHDRRPRRERSSPVVGVLPRAHVGSGEGDVVHEAKAGYVAVVHELVYFAGCIPCVQSSEAMTDEADLYRKYKKKA